MGLRIIDIQNTTDFVASSEDDVKHYQECELVATTTGGKFEQVEDLGDAFIYENEYYYGICDCGISSLYVKRQ